MEIFSFFECAANHIEYSNYKIEQEPDERPLTFVKKSIRSWYIMGNEFEAPKTIRDL